MNRTELFSALGIPSHYGKEPRLPGYSEAKELEDVGPNVLGRQQRLAPDTALARRRMQAAAADDCVRLLIVSGFRSLSHQAELIRQKLAAGQDIAAILTVNAAPGYSEHHSGKAIDVATPGSRPLTAEFESTTAFAWLVAYAGRYGFRMSYGRDNPLGFAYEPWHWSRLRAADERRRRAK
jgi:D-alanyl-D-alanine carboxypeptidase